MKIQKPEYHLKKKRIKKTGVFNLMDVCHGSQVIGTCAVKVCPSQEMEED